MAEARKLDPMVWGALRGTRFDGTLRDTPSRAETETAAAAEPKERAQRPAKPEPYIPRALQRFLQMAERKGRQK